MKQTTEDEAKVKETLEEYDAKDTEKESDLEETKANESETV